MYRYLEQDVNVSSVPCPGFCFCTSQILNRVELISNFELKTHCISLRRGVCVRPEQSAGGTEPES